MNDIKFITLDNGLTILLYSDKSKMTNRVELITFIGGMTNEYEDCNANIKKIKHGTAHLLEHYVYENTIYGDLMYTLYDNKAISSNAVTFPEKTVMYFETVYNFKDCLKLFLEGMYNVIFSKERLDKVKYAVYNEIRDNKDIIKNKIYWKLVGGIFNSSLDNLGTKTSIKNIGYKYLKDVYDNFYVPKNQFLVVAGNFDEKEIIEFINEFYSKYTFNNNSRMPAIREEYNVVKIEQKIIADVNEIVISYKINTNNMSSFDKYKFDWYLGYFGDINFSKFSMLNEKLKNKNIIIGDMDSYVYNRCGYAILEIFAYTDKKDEFFEAVNSVINDFEDSKDAFELNKKKSILHLSVRSDNISDYVEPVVDNYILFDYPHNDTIDFVNSLNYDEYMDIIDNINFDNYSILVVKSKK